VNFDDFGGKQEANCTQELKLMLHLNREANVLNEVGDG
jgi:hypothetical protein